MASDSLSYDPEIIPEFEEENYFDASRFLLTKCASKYDEYLGQAVVKEKGICMEELEEGMTYFYGQLVTSKSIWFAAEPIMANQTLVASWKHILRRPW